METNSPKINNYYQLLEKNEWIPEEPDIECMINRWNSNQRANIMKNNQNIRIKIQRHKKRFSGWEEMKDHDPPNIYDVLKDFENENSLDIQEKIITDFNNEQQLYASFNIWNIEEPPMKKSKMKVSWVDQCDSDNETCTVTNVK